MLNDVSNVPKSFLYYRSQLNFIGGLGVIVLAVAVLPLLGIGGAKLYQSEMPGPFKEERLTPRRPIPRKPVVDLPWAGISLHRRLSSGGHAVVRCVMPRHFHRFARRIFHPQRKPGVLRQFGGGNGRRHFSILAAVNFTLYFVAVGRRSLKPLYRSPELRFSC